MSDSTDDVDWYDRPDDHSERGEVIPVHEVVGETAKAWNIRLKEGSKFRQEWFPKSQCLLSFDKKTIEVPSWLLDSKGIT